MATRPGTVPRPQPSLSEGARPLRPAFLYPLFFGSGAAALGYQMIWTRMFAAGLGHEVPSLISVAAAFLGGMALGAWLLDKPISRSANPAKWYASLELIIGAWSVAATLLIPVVNQLALQLIGDQPSMVRQWVVVLVLPFVTLLPATIAMGATLPAMDRFLAPLFPGGRCVGAFYAANTLGAVAGTLGSVYLLAPALGFRGSGLILAGLNVACGLAAWAITHKRGPGIAPEPARRDAVHAAALKGFRMPVTMFATGLLGVGFELVGVRVLSRVLENTIFTFAVVLAVYLAGNATGAAIYQRFAARLESRQLVVWLLCGLSGACLVAVCFMRQTPAVYDALRLALGESPGRVMLAELLVAAWVFLLPTVFMGATFSHLVQGARRDGGGVGKAAALNTLGCAVAGLVFVVGLLPGLGAKWTLVAIASGYLLLLPRLYGRAWIAFAFPAAALLALPADLRLQQLPPGAALLDYRDGVMASVAVVKAADGHRSLRVNNRFQMGGTAAAVAERRQAHLPLLLHPNPHRALFLGPGTGITLGAAGAHPGLSTDGVELLSEVVEVMAAFEPENRGPFPNAGVRLAIADARRFVRATTNRYDVIVGDLFHPAQDGAGFLYTAEHFAAIRARLERDGLFCQWLPLHQLDDPTLRVIVRTFLEVFPDARAFLLHFNVDIPVLGLVGGLKPWQLSPDTIEQRARETELQQQLKSVGLERPINLLGCFAAGTERLREFSVSAQANTDDHPVVTFMAPRAEGGRRSPPGKLLLKLIGESRPVGTEGIMAKDGVDPKAFLANLNDFIAARDLYLKGLVEEGEGRLPAAIDLYLQSTRRSLFFTPAYARSVTIIQVMAGTDREAARRLFQRLEEAQPAQPLGRKLLEPLLGPP